MSTAGGSRESLTAMSCPQIATAGSALTRRRVEVEDRIPQISVGDKGGEA
jgi:hypothetical protein